MARPRRNRIAEATANERQDRIDADEREEASAAPPTPEPEQKLSAPVTHPERGGRGQQREQRRDRRRKAGPSGELRRRLAAPARPGFERRWVNDEGNNLSARHADDWDHVEDPDSKDEAADGKRIRRAVGTQRNGQPLFAYLMEKHEDWYKDDQGDKQKSIQATEDAIRRGRVATEAMKQTPDAAQAGRQQLPEFYGQAHITHS